MIATQAIEKTEDGVIYAGPCKLCGFTGYCTSDDVAITLQDNASAALGTVLDRMTVDFTTEITKRHDYANPLDCKNGIYLTITGTTPKIIVHVAR